MPLNVSSLGSELASSHESHSDAVTVAGDYAKAIANFWSTAGAPGMGVVDGAATEPVMFGGLVGVFSVFNPSPLVAAQKFSNVVFGAVVGLLVSGGLYGVHVGLVPGPVAVLSQGMGLAWQSGGAARVVADMEASVLDLFTKACIVSGTGVETPVPIPKIGPLF